MKLTVTQRRFLNALDRLGGHAVAPRGSKSVYTKGAV